MTDSDSGFVGFVKAFARRQYFWGIVAIILLLVVNLLKDPTYLAITVSGSGNLVGNLIDILRAAAPIMMIAVGMCLVVATGG
ncbi:MAG: ABC transporter permease, partial [Microbacterium gubbeenense]